MTFPDYSKYLRFYVHVLLFLVHLNQNYYYSGATYIVTCWGGPVGACIAMGCFAVVQLCNMYGGVEFVLSLFGQVDKPSS